VDISSTPDGVLLGKTLFTDTREGTLAIVKHLRNIFYIKRWTEWILHIKFLDENLHSITKVMSCSQLLEEADTYHKATFHNKSLPDCHIDEDCDNDHCEVYRYNHIVALWVGNTLDDLIMDMFDTYKFQSKCKMLEGMICPITHEPLDPMKAVITPCGHWFDNKSVWSKLTNNQCPMCRAKVESYQLNLYPK